MPYTSSMLLILYFLLPPQFSYAQQEIDKDVKINLTHPKYIVNKGPIIGIDGGHNNLHTLDGGFAPFGKLVETDGYQTKTVEEFSEQTLKDIDILVIANPLHSSNIGNWKLPTPSAFSSAEITLIEKWVKKGGNLLLIADHMPYAGAANALANAFGFSYENGFTMSQKQLWPPDTYTKSSGNILDNIITQGVDTLAGFTGSALNAPNDATVIATFPKSHQLFLPETAWNFKENCTTKSAKGYVLGAIKAFGKGNVAMFTEAGMFTAQIIQNKYKVGFSSPKAKDNQQFILNIIHWLDDQHQNYKLVKQLLSAQGEAFSANNMIAVANHYHSNAVIYEPTGDEIRGIDKIRAYWKRLDGKGISWKTDIKEVDQIGEQLLAVCELQISFLHTNNQSITAKSKALITFKKENGTYKIHRDFYMPIK